MHAGDAQYLPSNAVNIIEIGKYSTSISGVVDPETPIATEPAVFVVTIDSGATGTPALAGATVTLSYGDGSTDTGTTNATGQATFTHTYATAGSFSVTATFAGNTPFIRQLDQGPHTCAYVY